MIKILGCGGYHPTDQRHTACFFLPEDKLVLEAGTGMFRLPPLLQRGSLDICLSHAHLDHVVGLTYLLYVASSDALSEIRVHAEAEKIEAIQTHLFSKLIFPVQPKFRFVPLAGPITLDGCQISWFNLRHPGGSVGYRIDWQDRSLAYVTDTTAEPGAPYIDHIRDVDLLMHECHFDDGDEELAHKAGHSCVSAVADLAIESGAKQLLLVHLSPDITDSNRLLQHARQRFPNVNVANDNDVVPW